MGELRVGDLVFDDVGQPTTVTGVYDQPTGRECFELTFSDGARIVADAEHLWWTEDRSARVALWPGRPERERRQRLGDDVIKLLTLAACEADADATLTIPDAARLVGCHPTSGWLHQIARGIQGAIDQPRVVDNTYQAQTVTQTQTVRVFNGPATTRRLQTAMMRSRRLGLYRHQIDALQLEAEVTVAELSAQTGISKDLLHGALRGTQAPPSYLDKRQVQLQVPARTLRRRFGTTTAYPARAFLTALADGGRELLNDQRQKASIGKVRTTRDILNTLRAPNGHLNHSVPVSRPLDLPDVDLPIAPYTLGAWLGDGHSWQPVLTSADPEIVEYIEADGYQDSGVQPGHGRHKGLSPVRPVWAGAAVAPTGTTEDSA